MKAEVSNSFILQGWGSFLTGILLSTVMLFLLRNHHWSYPLLSLCIVALFISMVYRSFSLFADFSILLFGWGFSIWFADLEFFFYLFLSTAILLCISHREQSRLFLFLTLLYACGFFGYGIPLTLSAFTAIHWIALGCVVVSLMISIFTAFSGSQESFRKVDALVCSYSGNTAHYFEQFRQGMQQVGTDIVVHRFHYHKDFEAELQGDALVIAFPVIGWKMPWPFLAYLARKLPQGKGKPAYILYTAAGGPENAGFVAWILLTLKGYRVRGRAWAIYPNNIATIRLGPKSLWKWLDHLIPVSSDLHFVQDAGKAFAKGKISGMPILFWPFPLFLMGMLIENKVVNRIYYHYVWKKRCTRCGLCVRYCPSSRLFVGSDGYPRAKGECALCMGCINLCPANAIHVLGFTEYGHPYHPRWPELVMKGKPDNCPNKKSSLKQGDD